MKIRGLPGELAFKAILDGQLTTTYFFNLNEIKEKFPRSYEMAKWPVEIFDDGSIYIPDISELE